VREGGGLVPAVVAVVASSALLVGFAFAFSAAVGVVVVIFAATARVVVLVVVLAFVLAVVLVVAVVPVVILAIVAAVIATAVVVVVRPPFPFPLLFPLPPFPLSFLLTFLKPPLLQIPIQLLHQHVMRILRRARYKMHLGIITPVILEHRRMPNLIIRVLDHDVQILDRENKRHGQGVARRNALPPRVHDLLEALGDGRVERRRQNVGGRGEAQSAGYFLGAVGDDGDEGVDVVIVAEFGVGHVDGFAEVPFQGFDVAVQIYGLG
jgi:hypothetical protein